MKITSHFAVRENGDDCWCQLKKKHSVPCYETADEKTTTKSQQFSRKKKENEKKISEHFFLVM